MEKIRNFWGWGFEGAGLTPVEQRALAKRVQPFIAIAPEAIVPPTSDELHLPTSRIKPPDSLAPWCQFDAVSRAGHTYGKSFRDIVRALERRWELPPDVVVSPPDEDGVVAVLEWASQIDAVVIPYGGGSSVVGGVEAPANDDRPVISCDLGRLDRVLEIDTVSRAALVQAGVFGPSLEAQLRPHELTLRHYPQSFEVSSLGGWIATRSGGHYATLLAVDGVQSVDLEGARETAQYGPGSGGTLAIRSDSGTDRYRYTITNFIPGVDQRGGLGDPGAVADAAAGLDRRIPAVVGVEEFHRVAHPGRRRRSRRRIPPPRCGRRRRTRGSHPRNPSAPESVARQDRPGPSGKPPAAIPTPAPAR